MPGEHLREMDYDRLLREALARVDSSIDTRQGSIIYDTLAIGAAQLAQAYGVLEQYYLDSFAQTCVGEELDLRAGEVALTRGEATRAIVRGVFEKDGERAEIAIGARFSGMREQGGLIYAVTSAEEDGSYRLQCETAGDAGNGYTGPLLPLEYGMAADRAEITEILIPGRDAEGDEDFRARYFQQARSAAFGGNIAQYRQEVLGMGGVGGMQIYPCHAGGGTVLISLMDARLHPAGEALLQEAQQALDPPDMPGQGIGIAPIGHTVTVAAPVAAEVAVGIELSLGEGISMPVVEGEIAARVEGYFQGLRKGWGNANESNVYGVTAYRARIASLLLDIEGIENVLSVRLGGLDEDRVFAQSKDLQELPFAGAVSVAAR